MHRQGTNSRGARLSRLGFMNIAPSRNDLSSDTAETTARKSLGTVCGRVLESVCLIFLVQKVSAVSLAMRVVGVQSIGTFCLWQQ